MLEFKLTLVRHGETEWNRIHIVQGQGGGGDVDLNEKGRKQAEALGKFLSKENYSHVFSSDLSRARETCEIVLANNQNQELKNIVKFDRRIRERNYGIFEGRPSKEMEVDAKKSGLGNDYTPEGGETRTQMRERASEFFIDLCNFLFEYCNREMDANPHVLVVSHGAFLRVWLMLLVEEYNCLFPNGKKPDYCLNTGRSNFVINFSKNSELPIHGNNIHSEIRCKYKVSVKCTDLYNTDHYALLDS